MSQDDGPRRSPSCNEPHLHSDTAVSGNNHLSATQDTLPGDLLEEGTRVVNASSDIETAAGDEQVKVFHTPIPDEQVPRRHKALGNHGSRVDGEEFSVEGQQEQSNENDDVSTTTTSSPIQQQVDRQGEGEGEGGDDDMVDSDDVNMEDDGSLEVSTVPVAEEVDEEWWDLKMQWGGKVYDIRVGGNDM